MHQSRVSEYRSPADGSPLRWADGVLVDAAGRRFPVENGTPDLTFPQDLAGIEADTRVEYDRVAETIYDTALEWQFASFFENEDAVRESMVDMLGLSSSAKVLEIGCGTGRDSFRIARRLGGQGALFMQDLSPGMVRVCERVMAERAAEMNFACRLDYSVSNATALPFADDSFDAVFHFGGFNQFGDLKKGAAEFSRVAKRGGRIVFGDEAVAPWLKDTEFEGIVTTNNALFRADAPLAALPVSAREVTIRWMVANCFYVIGFTKGDGPPALDLDRVHKGWRGGSMRSRYFGQLEGVTPEAKELVKQAAAKAGVSIHEWLDTLLKDRARRELDE